MPTASILFLANYLAFKRQMSFIQSYLLYFGYIDQHSKKAELISVGCLAVSAVYRHALNSTSQKLFEFDGAFCFGIIQEGYCWVALGSCHFVFPCWWYLGNQTFHGWGRFLCIALSIWDTACFMNPIFLPLKASSCVFPETSSVPVSQYLRLSGERACMVPHSLHSIASRILQGRPQYQTSLYCRCRHWILLNVIFLE